MAAARANNDLGVLILSPELEVYLAAHPPNADANLDAESKDLLEKLRGLSHARQQFLASLELFTIIPGDEPGVFTTNRPLASEKEVHDAGQVFTRNASKGSEFDLWLTPELEARMRENGHFEGIM